ncbi:MAG: hypothetical protein KA157_11125, partial [Aliarcobacter sp.]|nr:hypothetical protein [Aliarcobacter sp.]
ALQVFKLGFAHSMADLFRLFSFGLLSAKEASKISHSLNVPPPCFSSLLLRKNKRDKTLPVVVSLIL